MQNNEKGIRGGVLFERMDGRSLLCCRTFSLELETRWNDITENDDVTLGIYTLRPRVY